MNKFEKAATALKLAADEYEKIPVQLRGGNMLGIKFFSPEILRSEATSLLSISEIIKEEK